MATRNHRAAPTAAAAATANRGAARVAGKQKAAAGGGRPDAARQVLGDIGNVGTSDVLDGRIKLPEGIHRPITRSFGAQLLKAAALAKKNTAAPAQPAAAPARAVTKPARKVPTKNIHRPEQAPKEKRKPSEGPVKGSEGNRKPSEGAAGSGRFVQKNGRSKNVSTLSTVLSARSKAACGLTEKPKPIIDDIDKFDVGNQLALVDYVEDIYTFYKTAQHEYRPTDYMGNQLDLTPKMRAILTDWLIESHQKFHLMPETLYLTIYIVDRYLSMQPVPKKEFQLVGMAAMLIACKYEEIWAPVVNDFIQISDWAFTRQQLLVTEKSILNSLEWNLTIPTSYHFLLRFAKAAGSAADEQLHHTIFYFGELALMAYGMVTASPSMVAACAVYAARLTLKKTPLWTETLKQHTGLHEHQLLEGAKTLVCSHAAAPETKLKSVYEKYTTEEFGRVALHPPAALPGLAPAALPGLAPAALPGLI